MVDHKYIITYASNYCMYSQSIIIDIHYTHCTHFCYCIWIYACYLISKILSYVNTVSNITTPMKQITSFSRNNLNDCIFRSYGVRIR